MTRRSRLPHPIRTDDLIQCKKMPKALRSTERQCPGRRNRELLLPQYSREQSTADKGQDHREQGYIKQSSLDKSLLADHINRIKHERDRDIAEKEGFELLKHKSPGRSS